MTARARRDVTLWPGVLLGIGVAGFLDETILHQVLHWHHFYDRTTDTHLRETARLGLLTDGIFHAVSTLALAAGLVMLWRRRVDAIAGWRRRVVGATLLGAGGFNLYDGTVQHKLLKLHQVREGAHPETPYDVVFIGLAVAVLLCGVAVRRRGADRTA